MANYEDIIRRKNSAKANKALWETHLKECYRYFMPERNTIEKWSHGAKKRDYVFDSTAQDSLEDFATRMESELIPSNVDWIKLEAGTEIPEEEEDKVNEFLEETTEILFNHIRSSNFAAQAHSSFLDLGISTGALIVEPGNGIQSALNFRSVSLSELILEQSQQGIVTTVFREFKLPVQDIKRIYPRAKLNPKLNKILKDKPTQEVGLLEATIDNNNGTYANVVIYEDDKHFLIDETLDSTPWVIFRESVIPGETYGRGRAMTALPDAKTLNVMVRDFLNGLRWYTSPTFTATDDGVINQHSFSLTPGTVNAVGSNDNANPTLRPLQVGGQPVVLMDTIRAYQSNVRRIMISKPFGNIEETPVRTATEMSMRNADMAKTSLGASSRIQNELLESVIARCTYILKKAGKIPDFKVDGKEVSIKFTSPSARMQDEQTLAAIGRAMDILSVLDPAMVNEQIKLEDVPGLVIEILGLPASLKRSDAEKQQRAQERQAQEQQMQQMAADNVAAKGQ